MFDGKPPYVHANDVDEIFRMHRDAPIPRLTARRAELAPFDAVIQKAMAKDRDERYPSGHALAAGIDAALKEWKLATERREAVRVADDERAPTGVYLPVPTERIRVLVVDDDPDFLRFATRAVQLAFFGALVEISMASTGERAIASAERQPPHLVLLDFDMPGIDGLTTLSRMRALAHGEAMRVILISGHATEDARWKFTVLGVRNFVHKPVELRDLVERIQEVAQRSGWLNADLSA
jgi:serine/threonine-protein kinase